MDDLPTDLARARDSDTVRGEINALIAHHGEALLGLSAKAMTAHLGLKPLYARRLAGWVGRYGLVPMPDLGEPLPPRVPLSRSSVTPPAAPAARPAPRDLPPRDLPPISRWDVAPAAPPPIAAPGFERVAIPEDATADEPIGDLLARQRAAFERRRTRAVAYGVRQIKMPPGPFAIAHFGDPHLDDDGCDWPALEHALQVVGRTPGMYAGNVGDTTNNWVGRLVALFATQQATSDDAWRLARWFIESVPWLYIIEGNHDLWNDGHSILSLLVENARIGLMAPHEVRLELLHEAGTVRLHGRHDFPGHSQWNSLHALAKAGKLDGWADLYVAGHRHQWATACDEFPDGRVRWAVRARGFKRFDDYAASKGLYEQKHGAVVVTLHDPGHPHPAERIRTFLDLDTAAETLTWLRGQRGGGR